MIWGGIQKTSTLDFPGVLSCVLFTRGCDLDCFYCHNRLLIEGIGLVVDEKEIFEFLEKRKNLLDGVVVSGGEPTLHKGLPEFLHKVKEMGFKTKLDSNGQNPEIVKELWQKNLLDYVAIDIKALPQDYKKICGVNGFEKTAKTVEFLNDIGANYEVRTTLYPSMTIEELEELLASFPAQKLWRLNYFKMPEQYKKDDFILLEQPSITQSVVNENLPKLQKLQPNLYV